MEDYGICRSCGADGAEDQYSYGVYAGHYCVPCARRKYRDGCGHRPEGQGSPSELEAMGETYYEED